MQRLLKISFLRNRMFARAVEEFLAEQETRGVLLRNSDVPERICGVKTVLVDASLIMQGWDAVRLVAAPLEAGDLTRLKRQGSWMVLTAAVSLCCEGIEPLEAFATELNFARERMLRQYPQVCVLADGEGAQGMETTVHRDGEGLRAYASGTPSAVLAACGHILDGKERMLTEADKMRALATATRMEADGLVPRAFATKWMPTPGDFETEMIFLGVVATGDLPRADAPESMEALRAAGVRPVLVSDGVMTPGAVRASGVLRPEASWMGLAELDAMDDAALRHAAAHVDAFVSVDWKRKARIAKALRAEGGCATLSLDPEGSGIILALGDGSQPDAIVRLGTLDAVAQLLEECQTFWETYRTAP